MNILGKIILICSIVSISDDYLAQNEVDVFRYSNTMFNGSARYNGVAGAFGAVGADFSVMSTNPAGLGRFRQSDFSFTPYLNLNLTGSDWNNATATGTEERLLISNIGIVGVSKATRQTASKWVAVQYGFGYNRTADFNNRYTINGVNNTSLSSVFAADARGYSEEELFNQTQSPFTGSLAYNTWLIDPLNPGGTGKDAYTTQMYVDSIQTRHEVSEKGGMGEWSFGIGGNYNDKIYVGASVGFARLNFEQEKIHEENSLIDTSDIESFTFRENLATRGKGINAKLGIIFLPTSWLRLGASYQTPTWFYNMRDVWSTELSTDFRNVTSERLDNNYYATSPEASFLYRMQTPAKYTGSLAFVIKKRGLISLDYELMDIRTGKLIDHPSSGFTYGYDNENSFVSSSYRSVSNLRIGGELRITNLIMARAGFASYQNGIREELTSVQTPKNSYSFGLGYRTSSFYVDVAYRLTQFNEEYFMYDPMIVNASILEHSETNIFATVGFKF